MWDVQDGDPELTGLHDHWDVICNHILFELIDKFLEFENTNDTEHSDELDHLEHTKQCRCLEKGCVGLGWSTVISTWIHLWLHIIESKLIREHSHHIDDKPGEEVCADNLSSVHYKLSFWEESGIKRNKNVNDEIDVLNNFKDSKDPCRRFIEAESEWNHNRLIDNEDKSEEVPNHFSVAVRLDKPPAPFWLIAML